MKNFDEQLQRLVESALQEDTGDGDHSTLSCIPADARGKAILKIKQDGILAGVAVARGRSVGAHRGGRFAVCENLVGCLGGVAILGRNGTRRGRV